MASSVSLCSLSQTQFTISRSQPSFFTTSSIFNPKVVFRPSLTLRYMNVIGSQVTQKRVITVLASNSNPHGQNSIKETAESDTARGPPFLTILAGIVVFLLVSWVLGSIVIWFFGLIVKMSPSK